MSKVESAPTLAAPTMAWGRLAANCTAHMTEHLFNGVIAVILPLLTASLGLSLAQAGSLASARTLLAGAASFPSGFLADLARARNLWLGLCISAIGVSCLGLSVVSSFPLLLIFMALCGLGGGGFHPQSLAILSTAYRDRRAFALGVHDSSANFGEVVGPLAIGLLLTVFDWRTTLQIWAIPSLTVGLLYIFFGAERVAATPRPRDYKRTLWEDVIKNRTVFGLVAVSTLRAMGQTALSSFLPLYLALHLKLPAAVTGAYMSILFLCAGVAPAVVGWVSDRLGHRQLIALFSFASVASIVAIPYLGSGVPLVVALGALGVLLWALRPVIYGANMGVSFLAPLIAGLVADAYGLPAAILTIAIFPALASVVTVLLMKK